MKHPRPKRRWYQFSLKTLLVVLTLLCLGPGGYVAYEQNKARRQKAAVEAIRKLGGIVQNDQDVPTRSATMRQILGDESFGNVDSVNFAGKQVTDADLVHLADLTKLESLDIGNSQVTDAGLLHLVGLKSGFISLIMKPGSMTHFPLDQSPANRTTAGSV